MDLGYSPQLSDPEKIQSAISEISKRLDLVLIQEQFFESMILLKSALNLSISDITYFIQNAVDTLKFSEKPSTNSTNLSNTTINSIHAWNAADTALYEHFLKEFENRKIEYGIKNMKEDVLELKTAIASLQKKCVARVTYNFEEIPDGLKPFRPDTSLKVMGFVPKTNLTFKDHDVCFNVMAPELKLAKKLRYKQHMDKL